MLNFHFDFFDVIGALSLVTASSITSFIAWSLVAWGFTLNMLLTIAAVPGSLDEDGWVKRYTQNGGYPRLTVDRLGLLLAANFAVRNGDVYTMTPAGKIAAKALGLLQTAFGIVPSDRKEGV